MDRRAFFLALLPVVAGCGSSDGKNAPVSLFVKGGPDGSARVLGKRKGIRPKLSNNAIAK